MRNNTIKHKKSFPFAVFRLPSRGFTLMELMVVMAILGILITVGLTSYKSVQAKSRDARRKNDLKQISVAIEAYYNDKSKYPSDDGSGAIVGCGTNDAQNCSCGSPMQDKNNVMYMPELPCDPASGRKYYYDAVGNNAYQLYARIENTQDGDVPHSGTTPLSYPSTNCSTGASSLNCNYGVSSTNTTSESGRSPQ